MTSSIAGSSIGASSMRSQSEMYMSSIGTRGVVHTQTFREKLREARDFLIDFDTGKIFNRSPLDLLFWIMLHVILFIVCGLCTGFCLYVHYYIINWNVPMLRGINSLIKTPGLSFRPQPDHMSTLIRFIKGDESTYSHYMGHLNSYMQFYENENQQGENYIDCSEIRGRRTTELNKVCRFNIEWLGADCVKQQNFGFNDGQPCILLKLNKIYSWIPEEYSNNASVPREIASYWKMWSIAVHCDGDTPADRENMGPIRYIPEAGFHFRHYPYLNQQGFRSPLVFVRFTDPRPGSLIMVTCKAYAQNIAHDRNELLGSTRFELLVD